MTESNSDPTEPARPRRRSRVGSPIIDLEANRPNAASAAAVETPFEGALDPEARDATAAGSQASATTLESSLATERSPESEPAVSMGGGPKREPRRGPGWGALIAASLLGGVVGAGLTYVAQTRLGSPVRRFEARMAQLESRAGAPQRPDATAPVEGRLAAIETEQKALSDRVRMAEQAAEAAGKRAQDSSSSTAIAAPLASAPAIDNTAALDQLGARLAALETDLGNRVQGAADASRTAERRLAEQDKRLAAIAKQVAGQDQDPRLPAMTKQLQEQDQRFGGLAKQLQDQDQRLVAATKQLQERGPEAATAGLRVIVADRVAGALREGAPFAEALAAHRRFNADPARLAALEPFAASGAPTSAALLQEFRPLGQRILADARPAATSWSDRVGRIADSIVSVRPVGEAGSTTLPGLVGRIESALERGAIQDATGAWNSLPEPARRTSEEFGHRLKQRAEAEDAARKLSADALSALEASTR